MESIIPSDSRYIPLTQQRWCCVPTCIQMVMLRHNIPLIPAELIGYHMKLVVPKKDSRYFWKVKSGKKPKAGYGTQLKEKYTANKLFNKLKIPLKMDWYLIDEFKNVEEVNNYLKRVDVNNKDILVCFDWGTLFNNNYQGGHVCVLDHICLTRGEVRLLDPDYNAPKWRIIKIKKLFKSMKFHGKDKSAGFWELTAS